MAIAPANIDRSADTDDVVDLDSLTFEQLLEERLTVTGEIREITTQLRDDGRRPAPPEDDSEEWDEYRSWRRRARWALVYRKKELDAIKGLIVQRQEERHRANLAAKIANRIENAPAVRTPEQWAEFHEKNARQRVELLKTLADEGGAEALLLRMKRLISNLLPAAGGEYDRRFNTLDEADQRTLTDFSIYLLNRYGRRNLKDFVRDDLGEPS